MKGSRLTNDEETERNWLLSELSIVVFRAIKGVSLAKQRGKLMSKT